MTTLWETRVHRFGAGVALALISSGTGAEIIIHGGHIRLDGAMVVPADYGTTRGGNLFHSFSVFNVLGGESATFTGPGSVKNVIARVTGGTSTITGLKSSLIDGELKVDIDGANFYFFNPNGVVFGPSGSVNATGSVHISTADSLKLQDGGVFHADPSKTSTLTSAPPSAFGFLRPTPAPIQSDGGVMYEPVPAGKTFALVGGDIEIRGGAAIIAPGATASLASVASAGDVGLVDGGGIDVQSLDRFPALGRVSMSGASVIDVGDFGVWSGAGSIYIRAGELTLAPAGLIAQTFADSDGGVVDIGVRGNLTATIDPALTFPDGRPFPSAILAGSYGGLGAGPAMRLEAGGTLGISGGSFITTETYGAGPAGDLSIRAGKLEVRDAGTLVSADNYGGGTGPSLDITVGALDALDGGFVGTGNFGPGSGGALAIAADRVLLTGTGEKTLSLSTETVGGDAGDLRLRVGTLELRDGARISSSTGGFGDAGALSISASGQIVVSGNVSGIFSAAVAFDAVVGEAGNAGALTVSTPRLVVDGGVIDSTTVGDGSAGAVAVTVGDLQLTSGGQIRSFSGGFDELTGMLVVGKGAAGSVSVDATGTMTASGVSATGRPSGLLAETRGAGAGGSIRVGANRLVLADGARISSSSIGSGLAGDVTIVLGDSLAMRKASIATQAVTSDGGNIEIRVPRLIDLVDSRITTSVESGVGAGGNIFIDPDFLVLQRSQIVANAYGGPGGNITIIAGQLITDPASIIEASSALGIDGNVSIDAPNPDVGSNLVVLPESFLDASQLLQPNCGAARSGLSSLVEVGRGGLPADPDGYLSSIGGVLAPAAGGPALAASGSPTSEGPGLAQLSCTQ